MIGMSTWLNQLRFDPLPQLLSSGDPALVYFTRRDLLEETVGPVQCLWELPAARKILKRQLPDGSWPRSGKPKHPAVNERLAETFRQFRFLVEQFGFTRDHLNARLAAEFLFACQTAQGDIRGILANQHATYYTGAIMALLIQAGYAADPRIERGFQWLLEMRQDDLGWSIPMITHKFDRAAQYRLTTEFVPPVEPDRTKPFSHNWTGMVLRAFAVHPVYHSKQAAIIAANLLKSRFFQPDAYTSHQSATYWLKFEYPFWWNNLVSALDSLARIGLPKDDPQVQKALSWLVDAQEASGLWKLSYARPDEQEKMTPKNRQMRLWVSLAICRVFKRFHEPLQSTELAIP